MDWFRADEVAVALGRTIGAVYSLANHYGWAKLTINGRLHYSRLDVENYLEGRKNDTR